MKRRARNPVMTREDLVNRIKRHRAELAALGISSISLFGSFARDAQKRGSDIDLVISFAEGQKSFDHFMAVSFLLERVMSRKVQLLTRDSLTPSFAARIEEDLIHVSLVD